MATPAAVSEMPSTDASRSAATSMIVARTASLMQAEIPADVREVATQCVVDWFACAVAGYQEPLSRMLLDQALEDGGNPVASVIGHGQRLSARQAALLNGAYGHAIDYDDVSTAMGGHPTAAILPAIIAAAEAEGATGAQLLRGFVAGYEAAAMIGLLVAPGHYARGFHATGTVGAIGAAVGCATLMGLDEETTARAIGIAATQTAGLKAQFGTMCKPLHAGKASENGLVAAQLARRGFSSRPDILECAQGFAATQSPDFDLDAALAPPARGFHILNNLFKYNAACYGTHGAIEAARSLAHEHGIEGRQIDRIQIRTEKAAERMCNIVGPRTGLEGKFSLRFNTAFAVSGGDTSSPDSYTVETVTRPDLVELQKRVDVVFMSDGWPRYQTEIRIETTDGRVLTRQHDTNRPATDLAAQGDRLLQKFLGLTQPVLGAARAQQLAQSIRRIEDLGEVSGMMGLAR